MTTRPTTHHDDAGDDADRCHPHDVALDETDLDAELAATELLLGDSLAQLLAPPADLETRTRRDAASTLMGRSLLGVGTDLLTVGWQTLRFLTTDPTPDPADDTPTHSVTRPPSEEAAR